MAGDRARKRAVYSGAPVVMTIAPAEPYTLIEVKLLLGNVANPDSPDRLTIKSKNSNNEEFHEIWEENGSPGVFLGKYYRTTWIFRFEKPHFGGTSILIAYPNTDDHCGDITVEATWNTDIGYTDSDES